MQITNSLNLPAPLVAAIANDGYDAGKCDYSTTRLIKPPRIVALSRQHGANVVEDAADRIFSLLGRSIHSILEHSSGERYIVERRYFADLDGMTISGQIDIFDAQDGILQDWKLCSRWTAADGVRPEWVQQASINALLMRRNGVTVKSAQYVAIFRDWSKMQATREREYPQRQVQVFEIPLWPDRQTEQFIRHRISLHEAAKQSLPLCTDEERWMKPTRYALMKKGRKRAVKLYDTESEAVAAMSGKQFVETRVGEAVRCLHYCNVSPFCTQFREYMSTQEMNRD